MKKCGRCLIEKPLSEFNKDKYTKSGYRSQCKSCMRDERVKLASHYKEWRDTPEKKAWYAKYRKDRYKTNCIKNRARHKVASAVRSGYLEPKACIVCGCEKSEAHHDDYAKPLDVTWFCRAHHNDWHAANGEGKNAT